MRGVRALEQLPDLTPDPLQPELRAFSRNQSVRARQHLSFSRSPSLTKSARIRSKPANQPPQVTGNWQLQCNTQHGQTPEPTPDSAAHITLIPIAADGDEHSVTVQLSATTGASITKSLRHQMPVRAASIHSRRSLFGVFNQHIENNNNIGEGQDCADDDGCCCCCQQDTCTNNTIQRPPSPCLPQTTLLDTSPSGASVDEPEPPGLHTTDLSIDMDENEYSSAGDSGRFSCLDNSIDGDVNSVYRSCPDLLEACSSQARKFSAALHPPDRPPSACAPQTNLPAAPHTAHRRTRPKWLRKAVRDWSMDELLIWLQHLQLDDVASLLIGYEVCPGDVDNWTVDSLHCLGINDHELCEHILTELQSVKRIQQQSRQQRKKKLETSLRPSQPLFNLVRASSYDQIVAFEVPLNARDISVKENAPSGLQVTKINNSCALKTGDCILEVNSVSTAGMAAVDFNRCVHEKGKHAVRLVVLRRTFDTTAHEQTDTDPSVQDHQQFNNQLTPDTEFKVMHF